jgi:hypothetical protein
VLVVDQPGVYLGASYAGEPGVRTGVVPWSRIGSVVLYRQRIRFVHGPRYKPAVGLSGRPDGTDVFAYRIKSGWTFDRRAIQSALDRFAPGVQVVDGPRRAAADAGP